MMFRGKYRSSARGEPYVELSIRRRDVKSLHVYVDVGSYRLCHGCVCKVRDIVKHIERYSDRLCHGCVCIGHRYKATAIV